MALVIVGWLIYKVFCFPDRLTDFSNPTDAVLLSGSQVPATSSATPPSLNERLRSIDWFQFEKLIEIVYQRLGYTVTRLGGAKPDGGIDLILEKDGAVTAVQCKHWKTWKIRPDTVRAFRGAMADREIKQGILVTTAGITTESEEFALRNDIEIVTESKIVARLKEISASDPKVEALLSDRRKFCPKCESLMILRTARKGRNPGSRFWGCSNYPQCRFTMDASDQQEGVRLAA